MEPTLGEQSIVPRAVQHLDNKQNETEALSFNSEGGEGPRQTPEIICQFTKLLWL